VQDAENVCDRYCNHLQPQEQMSPVKSQPSWPTSL
jgi:hypothetical protein